MLSEGMRVQTPYAVGLVKSAAKNRLGDWVIQVERESDKAVHSFYLDGVTPHRIYQVSEIVRYQHKGRVAYGEVIYRFSCGQGRHSYEIALDGETDTVWANLFQLSTLGSKVGDYPAWDRITISEEDIS